MAQIYLISILVYLQVLRKRLRNLLNNSNGDVSAAIHYLVCACTSFLKHCHNALLCHRYSAIVILHRTFMMSWKINEALTSFYLYIHHTLGFLRIRSLLLYRVNFIIFLLTGIHVLVFVEISVSMIWYFSLV